MWRKRGSWLMHLMQTCSHKSAMCALSQCDITHGHTCHITLHGILLCSTGKSNYTCLRPKQTNKPWLQLLFCSHSSFRFLFFLLCTIYDLTLCAEPITRVQSKCNEKSNSHKNKRWAECVMFNLSNEVQRDNISTSGGLFTCITLTAYETHYEMLQVVYNNVTARCRYTHYYLSTSSSFLCCKYLRASRGTCQAG